MPRVNVGLLLSGHFYTLEFIGLIRKLIRAATVSASRKYLLYRLRTRVI